MIKRTLIDGLPILLALVFVAFVMDRRAPAEVQLVTHDKSVMAGDVLHVDYETKRLRSCAVTIVRSMVDADGVEYFQKSFERFIEASNKVATPHLAYKVPSRAAEGPAVWTTKGYYVCNFAQWIWPIEVHFWDLHFSVKQQ